MAIVNNIDRTYPFVAVAAMTPQAQGAGKGIKFTIPQGALLLRLAAQVSTAFDGTTPTLTAGDGTTTFVNAVDISSLGAKTVANAPKFYPNGGTLTVTAAGASTVGAAFVIAEYILPLNGVAGVQQ